MITMSQSFKSYWKNYFNFTGTATRAEYWWMAVWSIPIFIVWFIVTIMITVFSFESQGKINVEFDTFTEFFQHIPVSLMVWSLLSVLILLALIIPTLSLSVRRYRDSGLNEIAVWVLSALSLLLGWVTSFNAFQSNFFSISFSIMSVVSIVQLIISVLPTNQLTHR